DHGIVVPTSLPKLVYDFHIFVGYVIAVVVWRLVQKSSAFRRTVQIPSNNIPGDPSFGQVIERGDSAREKIGRFISHCACDAETQMARDHSHRRNDEKGIVDRSADALRKSRIGVAAI